MNYLNSPNQSTEQRLNKKLKTLKVILISTLFSSILLTLLISIPAAAEVDQDLLGSGPGRFNSIVADDIDDDGRSELVFGNYEGYVTVLEYRDGDYYEEWRSPKIGHRVWGIAAADFIGDDTKEIIAGNGDGEIFIYDSKSHEQVWHAEDLVRDVHGLLVHDLGSNGTKYLLAGTGYKTDNDLGTLYIFTPENTTPVAKIGNFENRFRGIGVGDVDTDGELEIVLGSGVATGENPGKGYIRTYDVSSALDPDTLLTETPIEPEWKSANLRGDCVALELADFTGDGYPDIVVGNGYRYQAGWVRILTYDQASNGFTEYWKSPDNPDIGPKPYGLAVKDIDSDSNLEIVVGNQAGYVYIYEQRGSIIVQEWKSKLLGSDILGIYIADIDSDDDFEIIAAQGGYTGKGDYTSGYTEPHIYIIDGGTHKIELIIGETSYLDFTMEVLIIILIITFLVALNYFAKYQRQIRELRTERQTWAQARAGTSQDSRALPPAGSPASLSTLASSGPGTQTQAKLQSKLATERKPISNLTFSQPLPKALAKPATAAPVVNDPFPPSMGANSSGSGSTTQKPPMVNDPFPKFDQASDTQPKPQPKPGARQIGNNNTEAS